LLRNAALELSPHDMPDFETRTPDRLSFPEALDRVLAASEALPARFVAVVDAEGRAAAEEVHSALTLPPSSTSHMDGYALRSDELSQARARLPIAMDAIMHSTQTTPSQLKIALGVGAGRG
jgi:molybdopterin molybdotransferase